jgi:DNA repair exonuclease SbcCD ATPase subunit
MGAIFEPVYRSLGLTFEAFELLFTGAFGFLLFLTLLLFLGLRRRKSFTQNLDIRAKDLEIEIEELEKKMKESDRERSRIGELHEEALAKLKEAKEVIVKREGDFKTYKESLTGDVSKTSALEEELKTYRIKLGELNKEKEQLMTKYEVERQSFEENQKKLQTKFEKDLEAQKRKISSN